MRKEEIENRGAVGKVYGEWEVVGVVRGKKGLDWVCRCSCGREKQCKIDNIRNGRSRMCKACSGRRRRKEGSVKWKRYVD